MSKRPKCENHINQFALQNIEARAPFASTGWRCLAYKCPHCDTVVSVQIDPTLIREEIIEGVIDRLRKTR